MLDFLKEFSNFVMGSLELVCLHSPTEINSLIERTVGSVTLGRGDAWIYDRHYTFFNSFFFFSSSSHFCSVVFVRSPIELEKKMQRMCPLTFQSFGACHFPKFQEIRDDNIYYHISVSHYSILIVIINPKCLVGMCL